MQCIVQVIYNLRLCLRPTQINLFVLKTPLRLILLPAPARRSLGGDIPPRHLTRERRHAIPIRIHTLPQRPQRRTPLEQIHQLRTRRMIRMVPRIRVPREALDAERRMAPRGRRQERGKAVLEFTVIVGGRIAFIVDPDVFKLLEREIDRGAMEELEASTFHAVPHDGETGRVST